MRPPATGPWLTAAQLQVLRLLADGLTRPLIADAVGLSERQVSRHLAGALRELGASTSVAAVLLAARGLLLDDALVALPAPDKTAPRHDGRVNWGLVGYYPGRAADPVHLAHYGWMSAATAETLAARLLAAAAHAKGVRR